MIHNLQCNVDEYSLVSCSYLMVPVHFGIPTRQKDTMALQPNHDHHHLREQDAAETDGVFVSSETRVMSVLCYANDISNRSDDRGWVKLKNELEEELSEKLKMILPMKTDIPLASMPVDYRGYNREDDNKIFPLSVRSLCRVESRDGVVYGGKVPKQIGSKRDLRKYICATVNRFRDQLTTKRLFDVNVKVIAIEHLLPEKGELVIL